MSNQVFIVKATGEREEFNPEKLKNSLERAGAMESVIEEIVSHIKAEINDGMSTKEIYRHAFELLSRKQKKAAAKYSLRKAIMELGPTGFPFEQFVAQIFAAKGYQVTNDFIAKGECALHEIDVTAWNENKLIFVEAKFHNELGIKSDLKVALYVKARWDDLQNQEFEGFGHKRKMDEGWLLTNTKFSSAAIEYGKCRNMKMVGWNYPNKSNLQDLIADAGLHPITCLESITPSDERVLMQSGIVLCKQALENKDMLEQVGLNKEKIASMIEEINLIQND